MFISFLAASVFFWIRERLFSNHYSWHAWQLLPFNSVWTHLWGPKWLRTLLGSFSLWRWPTWKTSWGTLVWSQVVGWKFLRHVSEWHDIMVIWCIFVFEMPFSTPTSWLRKDSHGWKSERIPEVTKTFGGGMLVTAPVAGPQTFWFCIPKLDDCFLQTL